MRRAMALLAVAFAATAFPACEGENPVEQEADARVTLSVDSVTIEVGASATVTAEVFDSGEPALFASRDESVATVSAGGAISGVGAGTTYVVASLANGPGARDSVHVRVNEPTVVTPPAVELTSIDTLRPGEVGVVRGSGLVHVTSLLLDGVAATEFVATSDSVAQFRVPTLRACETDMRVVKVSTVGATPIDAVVRVPATIALSAGESRVLTADDLACLRLAAADEDYVLSAANLQMPTAEMEAMRTLIHVRVLGTGDAAAATVAATSSATSSISAPLETRMPETMALSGAYSNAPEPFDPRYATAVVGDTLRFVDWFTAAPTGPDAPPQPICFPPADSVPTFEAQVVSVSGDVAVVIDLRHPVAAYYLEPSNLAWLHEAVAMTERLLLPTMRSIFDAAYEAPAGGGGRFYVMLGNIGSGGFAYDGTLPAVTVSSQELCPNASEMVVSTVGAYWLAAPQNQNPGLVAGLFLHEYAHNADLITSRRGRTQSILNEGLASLAEETASRIASGQPLNARHSQVGSDAPLVTGAALGMWGTQPQLGPWQYNGRYGANARMLLFLRELAGEASVDHERQPTLYQRLIDAPINWLDRSAVIGHITSELDIEYSDLTDRQALASVTAGLIDEGVAHDLPRYTSWDHAERALEFGPLSPQFPGRASRRATSERILAAADGGHAAMYLMADGARGVSLELVSMVPTARVVRLTRLR
ncbi:MAG TPA: hypothetical protein VF039_00370 [Longimicrobiales bacterium]